MNICYPKFVGALVKVLIAFVMVLAGSAQAEEPLEAGQSSLAEEIQEIKQLTLELNRDLFILEEELLFPSNTQIAVFLSVDVGEFFTLDAVKLSIDGVVVSNYLYTERELMALQRGGVQRLHIGNLKSGEHEIVAVFNGEGPHQRDYRRGANLIIEKTNQAKHLELKITDSEARQQPEFVVKEW